MLPWSRSRDVNHEIKKEKWAKKYFKRNKVDGVGIELVLPQSRTPAVDYRTRNIHVYCACFRHMDYRTRNIHVYCAWFRHMDYRTRYIHVYRACFGSWIKERGIFMR